MLELVGVGDHTSFFVDRGCPVTVTEPRQENRKLIRGEAGRRRAAARSRESGRAGAVRDRLLLRAGCTTCHGGSVAALDWIAACHPDLLLLETCVSARPGLAVFPFDEDASLPHYVFDDARHYVTLWFEVSCDDGEPQIAVRTRRASSGGFEPSSLPTPAPPKAPAPLAVAVESLETTPRPHRQRIPEQAQWTNF